MDVYKDLNNTEKAITFYKKSLEIKETDTTYFDLSFVFFIFFLTIIGLFLGTMIPAIFFLVIFSSSLIYSVVIIFF